MLAAKADSLHRVTVAARHLHLDGPGGYKDCQDAVCVGWAVVVSKRDRRKHYGYRAISEERFETWWDAEAYAEIIRREL